MLYRIQRRINILFIIYLAAAAALAARVLYLQVPSSDYLSKAASSQRIASYDIEAARGNILDINGIRLTNREPRYIAVLKPADINGDQKIINRICAILGLDAGKITSQLADSPNPIFIDVTKEQKEQLLQAETNGISVINTFYRYSAQSVAKHVVGYLGKKDQNGQTGIEKFYEKELRGNASNSIGLIKDAKNNTLIGKGYRFIETAALSEALDVRLTIDYHIQKITENVMRERNITGAVVIEDVYTGDIKAMVSLPDFDQTRVENYLNSTNNELYNRATAAYNLGSIFKIIDVAAILEKEAAEGKKTDKFYNCTGSIRAGGNIFRCASYDKGGHGFLDMNEAFALSCNTWFIDKAMDTGYAELISMAERFGLGRTTGINKQGIYEEKGSLPSKTGYYSKGDIANLSIGQGAVMATPLQVAGLVATIANGGIKNQVNIVDSVIDKDGNIVRKERVDYGRRVISKEIADKIKEMMEAVTDHGTGTAAALTEYGGAAGKTGSAETGRKGIVHGWFAGYFPLKQPKYSVAVIVENGQAGGKSAAPVFEEIARRIMQKGY